MLPTKTGRKQTNLGAERYDALQMLYGLNQVGQKRQAVTWNGQMRKLINMQGVEAEEAELRDPVAGIGEVSTVAVLWRVMAGTP